MPDKKTTNAYDDGNIPEIDLPQNGKTNSDKISPDSVKNVEPLPESFRPRKDGPGGD